MNFDCGLAVHSRARTRKLLLAGTALATAILFPSLAQAQVWQDGGVDNGNYNQQSNWSTNTVPDTAGEPGTFANNGTAAVTVTLGPIGPQSWTFAVNSQSYTVTGQAVNLVTGITNNANAGQAISIANNMTGTTISQAAASTLTLSGTNSFTNTSVTAGTLVNALFLTSSVGISVGGTFNNSGALTGQVQEPFTTARFLRFPVS